MNILIQNGRVVSPEEVRKKDIWVRDGRIESVKDRIEADQGTCFDEVIDAAGKYVLPGIIDAHTHYLLKSRGTVTADDFYSGSAAGAIGGVTTAVDFADQTEGQSLLEAGRARIEASQRDMAIDFGLHQCIFSMHEKILQELEELRDAGITTVKIFTTYKREGYFIGKTGLRELFAACRDLGMMVSAHCEDDDLIDEISEKYEDQPHPPSLHPVLRPSESEYRAIKMLGSLAGEAGSPLYIVHLSSSRGLDGVQEVRAGGAKLVVETTPHYLLLNNSLLDAPGAQKYIMTPPLRTSEDNEVLWQALSRGEIQIVATDHCTFTVEQKMKSDDCRTVLPGIPGTEELLPLIHTAGVGRGRFDIRQMVSLLSEAPARFFGMYPRKGSLLEGTDADIVVFDPEADFTIRDSNRHTASGYTPYDGFKVRGMPVLTMLRGTIIARDGEFIGERGCGRFIEAGRSEIFEGI